MSTPTLAKILQDAVVAHLLQVDSLLGTPAIGRRQGNVANDIEAALGLIGCCIYVFPALPVEVNPNLPGPYVDKLGLRVRCIEVPVLNSGLPDAYELAEIVLTQLHERSFPSTPGLTGMNPLQCLPAPITEIPDDERVIFDINFQTSVGLVPDLNFPTTEDLMTIRTGQVSLDAAAESVAITFPLAFAEAPQVNYTIITPSGQPLVAHSLAAAPSATGFTVTFAAPIPASGYALTWSAIL